MYFMHYVTKAVATGLVYLAPFGVYVEGKELQEPPPMVTSTHPHEEHGTPKPGEVRETVMMQATTTTAAPWTRSAGVF
jgi:hypothetical protein